MFSLLLVSSQKLEKNARAKLFATAEWENGMLGIFLRRRKTKKRCCQKRNTHPWLSNSMRKIQKPAPEWSNLTVGLANVATYPSRRRFFMWSQKTLDSGNNHTSWGKNLTKVKERTPK